VIQEAHAGEIVSVFDVNYAPGSYSWHSLCSVFRETV